jgi:ketosteroid isomerase-like protein
MSQENVEIVRRFLANWAARDLDAALECVHAEVEFDWSGSMSPYRDVFKGHAEVRRGWNEILDSWEEFRPQIEDVIDCGLDRLITPTFVQARGRSGIEVEAHGAVLWRLREGVILYAKLFQNKEEALKAVGLSEQDAHADS